MSASPSTSGPLVLVVEDDPGVRHFLTAGLPAHGYRVREAITAEAGLRDAAQYMPDLVLLDLGLPDLDGLEVTRRLRAWSRVPIVVISARGQEAQKVLALDAGADDYLTKPFERAALLLAVERTLRSRRLVDENRRLSEEVRDRDRRRGSPRGPSSWTSSAAASPWTAPR